MSELSKTKENDKWILQRVALKDLKGMEINPRRISKHDCEQLKRSIEIFGECQPLVLNKDLTIIGGHQRFQVLKSLKKNFAMAYISKRQLSSQEEKELNLRLNRNTGEFDFDILANQFEIDELLNAGFTKDEIFCEDISLEDLSEEEEEEIKIENVPFSKVGMLYELGNHRLFCGDATDPKHVEVLLNSEKPILMVTDPPYGVEYDPIWRDGIGIKSIKAKGKVLNDNICNWEDAWKLFPGNIAYVWCPSIYWNEFFKSLQKHNFEFINQIIWVKQHFAMSRGDYHWKHEPCLYMVRKGQKHNWQGSRKETTVWEIANLNGFGKSNEDLDERTDHSTQKPLECMLRPIKNNSCEGESVYDPFGRSGTTLIAAEKLNRKCYMMEINPLYCDIIMERWKNYRKKHNLSYEIKESEIK